MEDLIHIDEKWFYLMKDGQRFIIVVDEAEPYRHLQHKSFLTKIMFLCVVAWPTVFFGVLHPRNVHNLMGWVQEYEKKIQRKSRIP